MVKSCCVIGCKITSSKGVTFFKFPGSRSLRRKWETALKVNGKKAVGDAICSRHFLTTDYQFVRGKTRLKAAVVPSVFAVEISKNQPKDNIPTDEQVVDSTKEISTDTEKTDNKDISSEIDEPISDRKDEQEKSLQGTDKETPLEKDVAISSDKTDDELREEDDNIKSKNATDLSDKNAINCDEIEKNENRSINDDKNEEPANKNGNDDAEIKIESTEIKSDNKCSISKAEVNISEQSDEAIPSKQSNEVVVSKQTTEATPRKQSSEAITCKQANEVVNKTVTDVSNVLDEHQDIEELLTDYHICQNNIHTLDDDIQAVDKQERVANNLEESCPINSDPVFIELSVDKEATGDCLMVLESVQVEVDPNAILQDQEFEVASVDLDNDDDDVAVPPKEPISLLTSSDEDEVIIQEPKIDTVEVSDETDEDDLPLLKLVKMKKMKKKKQHSQNSTEEVNKIKWGMYYCIECHFRTTDRGEYNIHRLEHAQVLLMCQLCGYMTSSEPQLLRHEKLHKDYKKYQCHLCDYRAKHQMSLNYHLKSHKAKNRFKCTKCGYRSNVEKEALRHVVLCKGLDGKRHCCDKCDYKTKKPSDLKRHKASKHKVSVSDDENDEDYLP
ncbi:unnamed protein product [Diatraea saccharalis]|uniref:Uncharacterized protein n=1 Tax=Diatraea saccharalis TaxID=40085 RepID=A0A9N9WGE5_9NEOP|nr:unnamed protein product [Diatraea saccharalis]